ncbi:MAG: tryptophanyl-tRNA synthetase [Candidatus Methanoperedens nitroreducens]|uniref:Tryptophan--tRNA ligase n=1 Tax=Candidatus Methanoperedens nitratireducens TaxID=1392998 RepID=A0A0P8E3H0_9EURY|nr:tryptophan--tRNA ligase [Candidatus Methanoperedens sp. BLZ2]KAB2946185.1 MAG: tryptophan--tRNA ligase [Candidatus Methanoperedens sp.]KPQ45046.1 MAG: tryptophanyl-tRNA synthetase [Candidatus Methanoperedens sp. BLZ1]MBZ0177628.1 tryptophan--tRNA ligase [Candidatus Methanoperedens nitroreducens]MCX9078120.1 tryptophan--tRNA ligase [Candidatus Methanoperedens sp.]MCX9086482.1 tryptophan--tRNA ligase [Candidatus Methanoperedens sp.]
MTTLDPWGVVKIDNYSKLFDEFGISKFDDLLGKIKNPHRYMRRHVIFGHRSYDSVLRAMLSGKPFAALSGFMPSGKAHLGHKMVMEEIIWHQQQGGDAFLAIADMEAHAVRGKSWKDCRELGINEYILSAIALGLEPGAHIYFQSGFKPVRDLSFELGIKANFSELSAIYGFSGETNIAHMVSALTQSADILHPQLKEFGGPKPVVIPVGSDQDPHIRLTRGLAYKTNMFMVEERRAENGLISVRGKAASKEALKEIAKRTGGKLYEEHVDISGRTLDEVESVVREVELKHGGYAFMPPASTYHKFMTGLQGGKMSSSIPESYIALTDKPEDGAKKVMRAITGGRVTLEEQKKLGGEPDKCSVYELLLYHLVEDDNELLEVYKDCVGGTRVCGNCKKFTAELMRGFLKDHQEKREAAKERLGEFGLSIT